MPFKIYTASKLDKSEMWKELQHEWKEFEFTARWFQFHVGNVPDAPAFAKFFWQEDEEDVKRADVVLVYAEEGDILRGALVEVGIALGVGIPVICVMNGENPSWGTWSYHPLIYRVASLVEAKIMLDMMANAKWILEE